MDLPDTIEVVDIRPAWQYAEYHIQAAANATPAAVLSGAAYLEGKRPLVLVCRDGFVSAAVGGALAQKSQRPIKVLDGGMARYYDEVVRPKGIVSDRPTGGAPPAASPAPVAPPATQSPTPAAPQAPAKKRAGC
jgi:rhodanese-related sulfurtransferase